MKKSKKTGLFLFIIFILNLFKITIYADNSFKEPTNVQIAKARERYEYSYQKEYSKNIFPYRLNNYEDINYAFISYEKAVNDLSGYTYPEIICNMKDLDKILYNNQLHDLKNGILIKDKVLYAEIKDIADILNCDIIFKLYKKDDEYCKVTASFKKYDKTFEKTIIKHKDIEFPYAYYSYKVIPGAIIEDYNTNYPVIRNNLIYVPLDDILEFFDFDVKYDKLINTLNIIDNSDRENLTWQEIYENAIIEAMNSGKSDSFALLDVTGDEIPEVFFRCNYYNCFDIISSFPIIHGTLKYYCFWYNENKKSLEIKADNICNYLNIDNGIALHRESYLRTGFDEKCIWDESKKDFMYYNWDISRDEEVVSSKFSEFKVYWADEILSNSVNIKDIINADKNLNSTFRRSSNVGFDYGLDEYVVTAIALNLVPMSIQSDSYYDKITRQEFCDLVIQFFLSIQGKTFNEYINQNNINLDNNIFTDTENDNIVFANKLGIVNGTENNKFFPNNYITKQEGAVLLNNLCNKLDINTQKIIIEKNKYIDDNEIAEWAKDSVYKMDNFNG